MTHLLITDELLAAANDALEHAGAQVAEQKYVRLLGIATARAIVAQSELTQPAAAPRCAHHPLHLSGACPHEGFNRAWVCLCQLPFAAQPPAPCDHPQGYRLGSADTTGKITEECGKCGAKLVNIDLKIRPVEAVARNVMSEEKARALREGIESGRTGVTVDLGSFVEPAPVKLARLEAAMRDWMVSELSEGEDGDSVEDIREAARLDAAELVAAAREQDAKRIAELEASLACEKRMTQCFANAGNECAIEHEKKIAELAAELLAANNRSESLIDEADVTARRHAEDVARIKAALHTIDTAAGTWRPNEPADVNAIVARLKAGIEVEPLTEEEIQTLSSRWVSDDNPCEDVRVLIGWAAAAQRSKTRPRVELTEDEFARVYNDWMIHKDPRSDDRRPQLMRMLEEARLKKTGTR